MQHEVTISIWPFVAIWVVLVVNCALLFILIMKRNPTIIINNELSSPKIRDGNTEMLDLKPSIAGNEKIWPPPGVLVEPPEPGNLFPKNIPSFKDKPKPSGFGDAKNG